MKTRRFYWEKLDRLSNLPDDLRISILSFLPMADAVKTSALSRKWRRICSSLSILAFDQGSHNCKNMKFRDIVNSMILCHEKSSIEKFRLRVCINDKQITAALLKKWIAFVVNHKVQEVHLTFFLDKTSIVMPDTVHKRLSKLKRPHNPLFTCSTLKVLGLHSINLNHPATFCFPLLKSFEITDVQILSEETIKEISLNFNCPLLENLVIDCIIHDNTLTINSPTVKFLKLSGVANKYPALSLCMPSLYELDFKGERSLNISTETAVSVLKANLYYSPILSTPKTDFRSTWAKNLLMGLCNVEKLSLTTFDIKLLQGGRASELSMRISFSTVKYLTLKSYPHVNQVCLISFLLRRFPNLQTLVIQFKEDSYEVWKEEVKDWLSEDGFTEGALMQIEKIEIHNFQRSEGEVELMRYLFLEAGNLERMIIHYSSCSKDEFERTSMDLMSFGKSSTRIRINHLQS